MKAGPAGTDLPLGWHGRPANAFELVTFASVAGGTRAYTIVVFQSNESFRYFEPSLHEDSTPKDIKLALEVHRCHADSLT
jgi:hypothetical protein